MKTLTTILKKSKKLMLAAICMSFTVMTYAQADGINYQAAIRDGSGNLVKNQSIDLKFTISEGSSAVFTEEHKNITTTDQGLVNVVIGEGTALTGTFGDVEWDNNSQEDLEVEVDLGSGYVSVGTQDFQAVPYALNVPWKKGSFGELEYDDESTASERVQINATNDVIPSSDLISLSVPSTSSDNGQFIEFERGTSPQAAINTDGSAEFKNIELDSLGSTNPDPGTMYSANTPMAWGYVNSLGSITSEFGVASVTVNATSDEFTITLDNSWVGRPAISVTPFTSNTSNAEIPGISGISASSNSFEITFKTTSNTTTTTDFTFVVYGKTK